MPRYVPPSLRSKDAEAAGASEASKGGSQDAAPSGPRSLTQLESTTPQRPLHTIDEIHDNYSSTCERSTLNDSKTHPKELSYIILFPGANPRWKPDRIIFAKTNINILPGYDKFKTALDEETKQAAADAEAGSSAKDAVIGNSQPDSSPATADDSNPLAAAAAKPPSSTDHVNVELEDPSTPGATAPALSDQPVTYSTRPIPIFLDLAFKYTTRKYCFHGYFTPARVDFLKPGSPELVRMLEQKFTQPSSGRGGGYNRGRGGRQAPKQRERDPAAWKKSLNLEWAVLQMKKVADEEAEKSWDPQIERHEDEDGEKVGKNSPATWGRKHVEAAAEVSSMQSGDEAENKENESEKGQAGGGLDEKKESAELDEVEAGLAEQSIA